MIWSRQNKQFNRMVFTGGTIATSRSYRLVLIVKCTPDKTVLLLSQNHEQSWSLSVIWRHRGTRATVDVNFGKWSYRYRRASRNVVLYIFEHSGENIIINWLANFTLGTRDMFILGARTFLFSGWNHHCKIFYLYVYNGIWIDFKYKVLQENLTNGYIALLLINILSVVPTLVWKLWCIQMALNLFKLSFSILCIC